MKIVSITFGFLILLVVGIFGFIYFSNVPPKNISDLVSQIDNEISQNNNIPVEQKSSPGTISTCEIISNSGDYILTTDIKMKGDSCIKVSNLENVSINCQNHSIILDQDNQQPQTGSPTVLSFDNVKHLKVKSCNIQMVNQLAYIQPILINLSNSNNAFISGNIFGVGVITVDHSNYLKFEQNTLNGGSYQQLYSSNNIISNNFFTLIKKPLQFMMIHLGNGHSNEVKNNTMDGVWDGVTTSQDEGADDAIILDDESKDYIHDNKIMNNWDCGIETTGFIQDTKIENNTIINSGICGIGAWYYNSWINNSVKGNIIDKAPQMFLFYRDYGLRSQDNGIVYFKNNTFANNKFINPITQGRSSSFFTFYEDVSAHTGDEKAVSKSSYVVENNIFLNNNFTTTMQYPIFIPLNMIVDGGNNICSLSTDKNYPIKCNN